MLDTGALASGVDVEAATRCDAGGTLDQMPTLVGWGDGGVSILYTEQNGTAVQVSLRRSSPPAMPLQHERCGGLRI